MNHFAKLNAIYTRLQDTESQLIFDASIEYRMANNFDVLIKRLGGIEDFANYYGKDYIENEPIHKVIFGAGKVGLRFLEKSGVHQYLGIDCFIDNYPNKLQLPLKCLHPDEYFKTEIAIKNTLVFISPYDQEISNVILKQLLQIGVPKPHIVLLRTFYNATSVMTAKQYFSYDFLEKYRSKNESFVDCGAYDGSDIASFLRWTNGQYEAVYSYEPSLSNFKKCNSFSTEPNVFCYNAGLWSGNRRLNFTENNGPSESGKMISDDGDGVIQVYSLDEHLSGKNVSYIKMDIEGAEMQALEGAAEIIKHQKPKLAICLYHHPSDFYEIPTYILKLNPDYKFYIRLHFRYGQCVLYAM